MYMSGVMTGLLPTAAGQKLILSGLIAVFLLCAVAASGTTPRASCVLPNGAAPVRRIGATAAASVFAGPRIDVSIRLIRVSFLTR